MTKITVDFAKSTGKVKPMHAVNNGPIAPNVSRNADGSNPCRRGTEEQFIEFYSVAAKH